MGITEKINGAKKTNWVSQGISAAEVKTTIELAKVSAKIERCRLDLGMTQKEFAEYMGVTQGMVSKWESREYNFTIRSLNEISEKLGLHVSVGMEKECERNNYTMIKWDEEKPKSDRIVKRWMDSYDSKGAIGNGTELCG